MRKLLLENKRQLTLGLVLIVAFFFLYRFPEVAAFLSRVMVIITPFIAGACLAFILDIPTRFFERLFTRGGKKPSRFARPISVTIVMFMATALVAGVVLLALPEVVRAVTIIVDFIPTAIGQIGELIARDDMQWLQKYLPTTQAIADSATIEEQLKQVSQYLLYGLTASTSAITSAVNNVWLGILATLSAVYMLLFKAQLCRQTRVLMATYLKKARAERLHRTFGLARGIFTEFVEGQALMAPVNGVLVFAGMLILGLPSAALVAVLAGVFAIIPLFGAIIAWLMGVLLMLMQNPMNAVWFSCLFIIIQLVTGNIIYPRVIGNSVGLPPLWTLVAVTVGGGLMGVAGMLLFVPLMGVCYALIKENIQKRTPEAASGAEDGAE